MGKNLVIVESPTKARTISKFLGRDFVVESSIGHIRDLPNSAKEIPEEYKKEPWARLGVNVQKNFEPLYVVPPGKRKQVSKLKALLKKASALYLATDEDREGESISWHLSEVLKPKVPRHRLVFHEITRDAIREALRNPRDIDERLVQAQETRRIVDRLYGYEVSPLLWRKIAPRLSAGRVQSVAVRIIVERERERMRFVAATYWDLVGTFETRAGEVFQAQLVELAGRRLAAGKDFDDATGRLKEGLDGGVVILGEAETRELAARLGESTWTALKVERKPYTTRPAPPFTTSTLQQEANRKLRLSARATMVAAQRLYENGHITYMRTDSVTLSEEAIRRAREVARSLYGGEYLSPEPRQYRTKVKNAQEAHEAIRPSADFVRPEDLRGQVGETEFKVYELIWKRTVACQMAEARGHRVVIQVGDGEAVFQATGKTIEFPGFLRAYVEGADDPLAELADKETILPELAPGDPVAGRGLEAKSHTTQPLARYTEASLVKELEADGIGRPSTYATIIETILRREYVVKQGSTLVPTFTAFAVVQLLERYFAHLVDVGFTARMEDDLDAISLGEKASLPYLETFYFGELQELLSQEIDARESCTLFLGRDAKGRTINVRVGRYGPYLERGDERASVPEGLAPDELTVARAEELLERGSGPQELGKDPESGKPVYLKTGRYGPYVQLGDHDDAPRMKSLLPGVEPEEVTLERALKLLSLPRSLGTHPVTGEEVLVDFGRYGPYVKSGAETRSLAAGDDVFRVTLERALELLRQEKSASWRNRMRPRLVRELGGHPETGQPVRLLVGRYGPYVTDGEVNAKIPAGRDPGGLSLEEAVGLLREKRAAGPAARRGRRRPGAGSPAAAGGAAVAPSGRQPVESAEGGGGGGTAGRRVARAASRKGAKKSKRSAGKSTGGARKGAARRGTAGGGREAGRKSSAKGAKSGPAKSKAVAKQAAREA